MDSSKKDGRPITRWPPSSVKRSRIDCAFEQREVLQEICVLCAWGDIDGAIAILEELKGKKSEQ